MKGTRIEGTWILEDGVSLYVDENFIAPAADVDAWNSKPELIPLLLKACLLLSSWSRRWAVKSLDYRPETSTPLTLVDIILYLPSARPSIILV